jgi:hypothetical protein
LQLVGAVILLVLGGKAACAGFWELGLGDTDMTDILVFGRGEVDDFMEVLHGNLFFPLVFADLALRIDTLSFATNSHLLLPP